MLVLASNFGGPYGLVIGCLALILIPICGAGWIWLQLLSLMSSERLSWLSLVLVVLFSFVPGFIVATTFAEVHLLGGFTKALFFASLGGLILLPITLTRESLKFRRDRAPPRRSRRRKPKPLPIEKPDDADDRG